MDDDIGIFLKTNFCVFFKRIEINNDCGYHWLSGITGMVILLAIFSNPLLNRTNIVAPFYINIDCFRRGSNIEAYTD